MRDYTSSELCPRERVRYHQLHGVHCIVHEVRVSVHNSGTEHATEKRID